MHLEFKSLIHGISLVLSVVIGGLVANKIAQKDNFKLKNVSDILLIAFIAGVVGARLLYFLLYRDQFGDAIELFKIWNGGLVSYGGFALGGLALWTCLKLRKENILKWFDYLAFGFMLGLFIGRVGDFLAGEIYGYFFHLPVSLFESFYTLIILFASAIFWARSKKITGLNFLLTLGLYSLLRFVVDFGRGEEKIYSQISFGQFFSLFLFIISLLSFIFVMKSGRKEKDEALFEGIPREAKRNSP